MGAPTISSSALNPFWPVTMAKNRHDLLLGVNGLQRGFAWNGKSATIDELGVDAPASAPTITTPTALTAANTITGVADSGGLYSVTTSAAHGLTTGSQIRITGVVGTGRMADDVNSVDQTITSTGATTFTIDGVDFDSDTPAVYTSDGTWSLKSENATVGDYVCAYRYVDHNEPGVPSSLSERTTVTAAFGDAFQWDGLALSSQNRGRYVELWRSTSEQSTELYLIVKLQDSGSVNNTVDNGGFVQIVFTQPHELSAGAVITVAGHSVGGYNTDHEVTSVDSDTEVTTDISFTSNGTGGTWSLNGYVDDNASDDALLDAATADAANRLLITYPDGSASAYRHTPPPDWMSVVVNFQDRAFYGVPVPYNEGTVETNADTGITGTGTAWTAEMVGRFIWIDGESETHEITVVGGATSITIGKNLDNAGSALFYVILPSATERNKWYFSSPDEPESVWRDVVAEPNAPYAAANETIVQQNTEDDDCMTGGLPHGAYLWTLKERHIYRTSFVRQPLVDIRHTLVASRGCFNQRCWGKYSDLAFLMDQMGPYTIAIAEGIPTPIDANIHDLWKDGTIDFANRKWFHVHVDQTLAIAYFFVGFAADSSTRPKRAVCFHIPTRAWWIEKFPLEIGSATQISISGRLRSVVGAEDDLILKTYEGTTDIVTSATRGTATSATASQLTDSTASFGTSGELDNAPVAIISGTGKAQIRRITSHTDTVLDITPDWTTTPAAGDVYIVGAIEWLFKSGLFELPVDDGRTQSRQFDIAFKPTTNLAVFDLRRYVNRSTEPQTLHSSAGLGDGVSILAGTPDAVVDAQLARSGLADNPGYAMVRYAGRREGRALTDRWQAFEMRGYQGADQITISTVKVGQAGDKE